MNVLKRILKGVILKPESTTPSDASNGALWYDSTLGKLRGYISGSARSVVNEDQSQTLTNKTIDADLNTINNIENGDIKAAAAIEMTKLAAMASDKAVFTDVSGFLNTATTTATELDYLSGVTSGVQAQLNAKASSSDLSTHMSDTTTHGTTGDIVGTSDTQNLSNKTFTNVTNFTDTTDSTTKDTGALVIDGGVGIEKSVTIGLNLEVLGNLTVQGTTTTINTATLDVEDANITINSGGNDAGAEGAGLTVDRTGTSGSFVYEDALASKFKLGAVGSEAQVVTVSHTQTLTNKTLTSPSLTTPSLDVMTLDGQASTPSSPSSGFYKAYVKDSTNKLTLLDSSGNETSIGAGGGAVNFVTNPDAEAGTTGYTIDSFAAASRPAGALTGTTTGITFSTSSSSPLAGVNSFTLAKDASNRQGRVVYTPITITPAYQAKVLNVSMDYIVSSGTFVAGSSGVDSDVIVYLQDVTNSTFIEPSSFKFLSNSSTIADKFQGTFQTSATGTSYRLLLYFPTTTTSAFTLKLDNISVSPSNYVFGSPIQDWQSFTPIVSHTTNATTTGLRKQNGDCEEYMIRTAYTGATDNTGYTVTIPGGKSIDTSKILGTQGGLSPFGIAAGHDSGGTHGGIVVYASTTTVQIIGDDGSGGWNGAGGTPFTPGSGDYIETRFAVPILGWSSSVQTSDSADTRVVAAQATGFDNVTVGNGATERLTFTTVGIDTHGSVDASNERINIIVPGNYTANANIYIQSYTPSTAASSIQCKIRVNGGTSYIIGAAGPNGTSAGARQLNCSALIPVPLKCGDYVELLVFQDTGASFTTLGGLTTFDVIRLSGPSAIAASESVNMMATSAATSIDTSTPTIVNGTKVYDSHGSYNTTTGVFTCPISGKYRISVGVRFSSAVIGVNGIQELCVKKNSDANIPLFRSFLSSSTYQVMMDGTYSFSCVAGDTLKVLSYNNTPTTLDGSTANFISIERTGN